MMSVFGYSVPLIWGGLGGLFVLPKRRAITTVIGDPVVVPHTPNATESQVREAHDRYCAALQSLYDRHADFYAPHRKSEMRIVDAAAPNAAPVVALPSSLPMPLPASRL